MCFDLRKRYNTMLLQQYEREIRHWEWSGCDLFLPGKGHHASDFFNHIIASFRHPSAENLRCR
ncbi:MAG: hypothetical protein ACLR6J_14235 [Parabacteroides merdae]